MKEQYHTPTNTYIEFRFEDSLRKYQKPPSKKIKCSVGKCNQCVKKNHQVFKAERLSKISSANKQNAKSNQKYINHNREVSPLGLQKVSDFNMGTSDNDNCDKYILKEDSMKNCIQLPDYQHFTPLKKKQTRQTPSQREKAHQNYHFSSKQNNSWQKNSVQNRCSQNIVFKSNEQNSQINIDIRKTNLEQKNQELKNFRDAIGQDAVIEKEESQIIGNIELRTDQKNNVMNHLESILRDKESPLAEYVFQMFDTEQYITKKAEKSNKKNQKQREEDMDTPFSKINMSLSVSQRKQLRGDVLFDMEVEYGKIKRYQTYSFIKNDQIRLLQENQEKKVKQGKQQQDFQQKEFLFSTNLQCKQELIKHSPMQVQQKLKDFCKCDYEDIPIESAPKSQIKQISLSSQQKKRQSHQQVQQHTKFNEKTSRKRKKDACLQQISCKSESGHLILKAGSVECLLSLRVLDKLINSFGDIDSIVNAVIRKRPYLCQGRQGLKQAIKIYLKKND